MCRYFDPCRTSSSLYGRYGSCTLCEKQWLWPVCRAYDGELHPDIEMIRTLKQHYGGKIYLVLRVDPLDESTRSKQLTASTMSSPTARTSRRNGKKRRSGQARLLKNDSYVFVDETSQHLLALVERVGAAEVTALMNATRSGDTWAEVNARFSPRDEMRPQR